MDCSHVPKPSRNRVRRGCRTIVVVVVGIVDIVVPLLTGRATELAARLGSPPPASTGACQAQARGAHDDTSTEDTGRQGVARKAAALERPRHYGLPKPFDP